jgi:hypothetical protein
VDDPYVYRLPGRRLATVLALAASLSFVVFALSYDAPWFALAPPVLAALMLLFPLALNPVYGMRLDRNALEIDRNGHVRRFPLDHIDHVRITRWTDSNDVTIHLRDGSREPIPQMMRPDSAKLPAIFERYAVKVEVD